MKVHWSIYPIILVGFIAVAGIIDGIVAMSTPTMTHTDRLIEINRIERECPGKIGPIINEIDRYEFALCQNVGLKALAKRLGIPVPAPMAKTKMISVAPLE